MSHPATSPLATGAPRPAAETGSASTTAALGASELRYRRLFEAAHDGILIVDPLTRRIVDVNPFLVNFLGYTRAGFIGRELYEIGLLKDEAASQAAFRELQATGHIRYEDLPLRTRDGRSVEVEFVSNLYPEGDHPVIQCNVRDITARKKAERLLQQADLDLALHAAELETTVHRRTDELRRSHEQLDTFVYSIAHDLRAPLRAMQGFAQLLVEDSVANLGPSGRDYANYINRAAQTLDQLLADLLAFSHLTGREIRVALVPLDEIVASALAGCADAIGASGGRVESIPPWPAVIAHAATLRLVLMNLVGNAVKFVADRPPVVTVRAEARPGDVVRIWVEDNGIGIPAEFHERIFQVFQRLHTTAYPGTGIGLALVRKGMERMGGRSGLSSVPGVGSRFWIELPAAVATAGEPSPAPETP
jgi:PAS domain S-box-containing protein